MTRNTVLLMSFGCVFVGACEKTESQQLTTVSHRRLVEISPEILDFGDVVCPTVLRSEITLINRSDHKCHIDRWRSSCGCVVGKITKRKLNSFETSLAEVELNVDHAGPIRQSITFECRDSDGNLHQERLEIRGAAHDPVEVEPRIIRIESQRMGVEKQQWIISAYTRSKEARILDVNCSLSLAASFEQLPDGETENCGQQRWRLSLPTSIPGGVLNEEIVLRYTIRENERFIKIPIVGVITGAINANPNELDFGLMAAHAKDRILYFTIAAEKPFRITAARINDPRIHVSIPSGLEMAHRFGVEANTRLGPIGRISDEIMIETSLPGGEIWRIPVKGFVVDERHLLDREVSQ